MLQTLIANGHMYHDIMEEYAVEEVEFFYRACVRENQEALKNSAVAARVAQADKKGWKEFLRELESNSRRLDRPLRERKAGKQEAKPVNSESNIQGFFAQFKALPKKGQVASRRR